MDIVQQQGITLEEVRQAVPTDKAKRKAAVCVFDEEGTSLLSWACWDERWDLAAAIVKEFGFPVDLGDPEYGFTALHAMCIDGRIEAALFLIRTLGANPHAVNKMGRTTLHLACQKGHTKLARILVRDFGLNANVVDSEGYTPLHSASLNGHTATALSLINDLGARVDAANKAGSTPLVIAAARGRTGTAHHHRRRAHRSCQQERLDAAALRLRLWPPCDGERAAGRGRSPGC